MKTFDAYRLALVLAAAALLGSHHANADEITEFGFDFFLGGSSSSVIDSQDTLTYRFTAREDLSVDTAGADFNFGNGDVTFSIREDDGGNPATTALGSGTATVSSGGWNEATLDSTVNLTKGQVYHLQMELTSGTNAGLRAILSSKSDVVTVTGAPDPAGALLFRGSPTGSFSAFSFDSRAHPYAVYNATTGEAQGQPYTSSPLNRFGGIFLRGQTFTFDYQYEQLLESITLRVGRLTDNPGDDDVRVHLFDASNPSDPVLLFSDVFISESDIAAGEYDFFTLEIDDADRPKLTPGTLYLLGVESNDSPNNTYRLSTDLTIGAGPANLDAVIDQSYQGRTGHHVFATWIDGNLSGLGSEDTSTLQYDSYFTLTTVPEPASLTLLALTPLLTMRRRARPASA